MNENEAPPTDARLDPQWLTVPLHRLAHGRTGDKGDRSNISVIAWDSAFWPLIEAQVTPEAVARQFVHRRPAAVACHVLPRLQALNIVIDAVLDGGVNDALNLDSHGKALAFHLLDRTLVLDAALAPHLRRPAQ